jgi:glutamyl-tRNA reductase
MTPHVVCGGLSFAEAPVELRERIAFQPGDIPVALSAMKDEMQLREVVLVSTCNRVEYFGATDSPERAAERWPLFLKNYHVLEPGIRLPSFHYSDESCVAHLFEVAAGLRSMVVGETEIFGQVKNAYEIALKHGATGKWMNRLFQSSFAAAKAVRTHTGITRGSVSVGSVAVELSEKIFGELDGRTVMVIGAGDTSEKTARSLKSRGVTSIMVANRTHERAEHLARELDGRAIRWDEWEQSAASVDIIISSTSAPHYVLTREKLERMLKVREPRPLFLIDLAVPRDFEPAVNLLDDVFLYDIDDLQSIAQRHIDERHAELEHGREILKPHVGRFCTWAQRQQEIERLGQLDPNRFPGGKSA